MSLLGFQASVTLGPVKVSEDVEDKVTNKGKCKHYISSGKVSIDFLKLRIS